MPNYFRNEQHFWSPSLDDTGNGTSTLYDQRGASNGTLSGGASWVTNTGQGGTRAIDLDGVDSYVDCGTLTDSSRSTLSAGGWIYPRSSVNQQVLIQNLDAGASLQGFLIGQGTSGQGQKWRAYLDTNATAATAIDSSTFSLDTWYHVFFTYDGTTIRLYVNGSEVGTDSLSGSIPDTSAAQIGLYSGIYSDALVDDIRVIESVLTATQVAELHDGGRGYERPSTASLTRLGVTGAAATRYYFTSPQTIIVGAASDSESASALSVVNPRTYALTTASETDSANALTIDQGQAVSLGAASESGSANALSVVNPRTYSLSMAAETDSAPALTVGADQTISLGAATETDSADSLSVINPRSYTVGQATETNTAYAITIGQGQTVSLGSADEVSVGRVLTVINPRSYALLVASETDAANSLTVTTPSTTAGFIVVRSAAISIPKATASISIPKATATITV